MRLIVGLGNPGPAHLRNRHNAGFMAVDRMALESGVRFEPYSAASLACRVERAGTALVLAKPQTYMNRSGWAVRELLEKLELEPARALVVYDDFALPLGKIRIRRSGSAGGHNGMDSVIRVLGTEEIPRLRMGIAPGEELPQDCSTFVLEDFEEKEIDALMEMLDRAGRAIDLIVSEGMEQAMARHN